MRNLGAAVLFATGAAVAEPVTIAALGDSLTQGYGLVPEAGLVPQLEAWLIAQGAEVRLLNAGVSGDTTAGGLARVGWTLTPEVDAMIVALGGNDLLRGIDPTVSRANLDGIMQAAQAAQVQVMLVGLTAPGNFGPDYKRDFEAMYPELATAYGALLVANFMAPLAAMTDRDGAMQRYMQADGIHPNAEGVGLIVQGLGPAVLELVARVEEAER